MDISCFGKIKCKFSYLLLEVSDKNFTGSTEYFDKIQNHRYSNRDNILKCMNVIIHFLLMTLIQSKCRNKHSSISDSVVLYFIKILNFET